MGILWYDECMVRYSNQALAGILDQSWRILLINTQDISGNQSSFTQLLGNNMQELASQAANDDLTTGKKYATRAVGFDALRTLYMLVQCTPDLSASDCSRCLVTGIAQFSQKQGGDVLQPSCIVRYETYPFFNGPSNSSAPAPPPVTTNNPAGVNPGTIHKGKSKVSTRVIIAIVVPVVVAMAMVLVCLCICLANRKAKKYDVAAVETGAVTGEGFSTFESLQYDLAALQFATNNFSEENKLGEGGFGSVYKGTLTNGQEIAVKKLSRTSSQGVQEFKNEAMLVAKLQHRNLARLLGFCIAGDEKLLIYEYVPNKSLDHFLFDIEKQRQLDWQSRYKIIQGIARGMLYLHQDSQLRIIHRDLKASNILLDADMNPKISDFGLARIFGIDQTQGNTSKVVGTYGYMSPEYAMLGQFSGKSDVYSFGVLILEIISGKRNSSFHQNGDYDLLSYAWKQWRDGLPLEFVDEAIKDSCSANEVMRCLHLGLICVQESVDERPTMATAVLTLDSYSVTLQLPKQPGVFLHSKTESNHVNGSDSYQSSSNRMLWSKNDVTISELDPR